MCVMHACHLAQVVPTSYSFSVTDVLSVNGSSITGRCSNFTNSGGTLNCTDPTSSVLFDGHIPTLAGLDGDMWASQLLTMSPLASTTEITFDFTGTVAAVRVERVEVVMFNCPQWGIGVQTIAAHQQQINIGASNLIDNTTSCEYLIRGCVMAVPLPSTAFSIRFSLLSSSYWIHLAEIIFHTDTSGCPPDAIVTGATPLTSTTPVPNLRETTTAMETQTTSLATTLPITLQTETTSSSECAPVIV